jgi:hypothetical protein
MTWTLQTPSETRSLAAWSITAAVISRKSLEPDTLVLNTQCAFDAVPFVAVDDAVVLYRDGVRYFAGRVDRVQRAADPSDETLTVTVVGPWWYLTQLVFQQQWNIGETENARYQSQVILYVDRSGVKKTTADQVQQVIDYVVASCGSVIQLAAGTPAVNAPNEEVQDLTCAEVVQRACRWAPDTVAWFDYATTPPTLHLARRAGLVAQTVDLMAGSRVSGLVIQSREDLQIPAIEIIYKRTDVQNGNTYLLQYRDIQPLAAINSVTGELLPAYRLGALTATIELEGFSNSYASVDVEVQTIDAASPTEATRLAWWKSKLPTLDTAKDARITNLSVPVATVVRGGSLPREILSGQITSWMGVEAEPETITAIVSYDVVQGTTILDSVRNRKMSVRVTATTAITKTYTQLMTESEGELVPVGVAASLYSSLSALQYEGQLTLLEAECSGGLLMGSALNLAGGRSEWGTMAAAIYSTEEDLLSGTTTLAWRPNPSLGPQELIQLLQVNRRRRIYTNPAIMQTGVSGGGGDIPLGTAMAQENSLAGAGETKLKRFGSLDQTYKQITVGDHGEGLAEVRLGFGGTQTAELRYDVLSLNQGIVGSSNYWSSTLGPGGLTIGGATSPGVAYQINVGPNLSYPNKFLSIRPVKLRLGSSGSPDVYIMALASDEFTL